MGKSVAYWYSDYQYSPDRLQVVSTRVGGVPEVLPDDLIRLADPDITGEDRMKECTLLLS